MTHIYFGDPNAEFSLKLAETLLNAGADILEVGIPYTDPVCDGEVFQRACNRALENGTTPYQVIEGMRRIRRKGYKQKIYLTSYYGPIFKIGINRFVDLAKEAGVTGLIVPDLLLEEQEELKKSCDKSGLSLTEFVTVYSSEERLRQIIRESRDLLQRPAGFIYCVSLSGVTGDVHPGGARFGHPRGGRMHSPGVDLVKLPGLLRLLKSMTKKPIFVGFGIKSKEDARKIMGMGADGVIVGSAIARIYEKNIQNPEKSLPEITDFIKSLKESTI